MKKIVITLLGVTASSLLANAQIGGRFETPSPDPVEIPVVLTEQQEEELEVQTPVKKEVLMKYLGMNGTYSIYDDVFKNLMELLRKEYTGKEVAAQTWKRLESKKDTAINDIINQISRVYKKNLSNEDLTTMMALYESIDYDEMIKDRAVFEAEKESFFAFYSTKKGRKISIKLIDVSNEVSAVNEDWSSNLYMDFKEILDGSL